MQIEAFSDLVLRLTHAALELGPKEHQAKLVDALASVTQFDCAWWGWSNFAAGRTTLVNTATFNLPGSFESAFRAVAHLDPFIQHGRKLLVFAKSVQTDQIGLQQHFAQFLKAFEISSVLNGHCHLSGDAEFNFFMSLYRKGGRPGFSREETDDFRIILRHLEQSLSLTLRAELRGAASAGGGEAAILSSGGHVVRATRGFRARLQEDGLTNTESRRVLSELSAGRTEWRGRTVILDTTVYAPGLLLVRLSSHAHSGLLSPAERRVLALYLRGDTMRQVAERMGVSVNTVRNQIASIYRKTGVRGKMALAQKMGLPAQP